MERRRTTLCRDNTALAQSSVEELKVGLLEEYLGGALGVRAVGDDDIEFVLALLEELKTIANVDLGVGVLETDTHAGEVLLGDTDDGLLFLAGVLSASVQYRGLRLDVDLRILSSSELLENCPHLINVAEDSLLYSLMLHDLTEDTAISTTNNKDLLRIGVRHHGKVCNHLLVPVQHQN